MDFYQAEYGEGDGITTFMPDQQELEALLKQGFATVPSKNANRIKQAFSMLFDSLDGVKVIDYGASWGYISYQLKSYGLDCESFEISVPRANFGNQSLGLNIKTNPVDLRQENDIFFSSHVIEHVPSVSRMLDDAARLVNEMGFVVTLCPNGSDAFRQKMGKAFSLAWGKVHPNVLSIDFFRKFYVGVPYFMATNTDGWKALSEWDRESQHECNDASGGELFVVACPHQRC